MTGPQKARCPHWRVVLHDDTLDTADGHYEPVLARISGSVPAIIKAMRLAFTDMIAPLGSAPGTRAMAARNWPRAIGLGSTEHLFPMSTGSCTLFLKIMKISHIWGNFGGK